jgi:hypothetical protein
MLREYNGRGSSLAGTLPPGLVDSYFYSESAAADDFSRIIAAYEKEVDVQFNVERKEDATIAFRSVSLSGLINAFYVKRDKRLSHTLSPAFLESASVEQKRRYIAGVYKRFGDKTPVHRSLIRMANAFEKSELVAKTLKTLGCAETVVYETTTIPVTNLILFVPTDALKQLLRIESVPSEAEVKAAHSGATKVF